MRNNKPFDRWRDGWQYDPEADEWHHECGACGKMIYAPYLNDLKYNVNKHISIYSNDCLGGW